MSTEVILRVEPAGWPRRTDGGEPDHLLAAVAEVVRDTGVSVTAGRGGGPVTKGAAVDAAVGGYLILQWLGADARVAKLAEQLAEWVAQRPEVVVTLTDDDDSLTIQGGSVRRQERLIRAWFEQRDPRHGT